MNNTVKVLKTMDDFENLLKESLEQPVLLMKLSPVCPVSHHAERQFQAWLGQNEKNILCYTIDVIGARPAARQLAEDVGVQHQSPQAILFSGAKPIWHQSHGDISVESLNSICQQFS